MFIQHSDVVASLMINFLFRLMLLGKLKLVNTQAEIEQ
jgi:hypothetical protein